MRISFLSTVVLTVGNCAEEVCTDNEKPMIETKTKAIWYKQFFNPVSEFFFFFGKTVEGFLRNPDLF